MAMHWLVFSYSLPPKSKSGPRVTLWRRLGRLGVISPTTGVYVLPARDECLEAFQWLAQEIQQVKGEALVMRVEQFEGLTDPQLIGLFNQGRAKQYRDIDAKATALEKRLSTKQKAEQRSRLRDQFAKLERQYAEIVRLDYFDCAERGQLASRLDRLRQSFAPTIPKNMRLAPQSLEMYRDKQWVTRPHPHVDRLACAWLIRRFINHKALIRYSLDPQTDEIAFDMARGEFGHQGNLCTFETMLLAFHLKEPSLRAIAEIVHAIDLRDEKYSRPEVPGLDAVLKGWLLANLSDAELEAHGVALFEGLYMALTVQPITNPHKKMRQKANKARVKR